MPQQFARGTGEDVLVDVDTRADALGRQRPQALDAAAVQVAPGYEVATMLLRRRIGPGQGQRMQGLGCAHDGSPAAVEMASLRPSWRWVVMNPCGKR